MGCSKKRLSMIGVSPNTYEKKKPPVNINLTKAAVSHIDILQGHCAFPSLHNTTKLRHFNTPFHLSCQ
jgi:hypothetical protein